MTSFSLTICALSMVLGAFAASFILPNVPGQQWVKVGYLNMSNPTQQCPDSWQTFTSPAGASCEKKDSALCDSVNITTSGTSYKMVCGRFLGYQIGSPDAFNPELRWNIETHYVDGVSITYGSPGNRQHVYTYAAGVFEYNTSYSCPCAGGVSPPDFVGSDYYCESGNPNSTWYADTVYYADVLWDGQLCRHDEVTCCDPPNLPWFCRNFTHPITEDLEVRICLDEDPHNENVALEFFELYILAGLPTIWSSQPIVYGVQGGSVQLNCTFSGLPVPNITWNTPNGSVITPQSHFMVQSTNTSTSLTISPLGPGDSGTYNCTATNLIGMSSASIQLIVQSLPTIWSSVYGVQGGSVQLNCTFGGLPVPNITWTTPKGSVLASQSHFMVQSTNTSTSLTISPLGPGDSGTYTCSATNSIGVSSAFIQLIVQNSRFHPYFHVSPSLTETEILIVPTIASRNDSKSDISIGAVTIGLISGAAVIVVLFFVITIIVAITCSLMKRKATTCTHMENVELEENTYEVVIKRTSLDIKHMEPCCAYAAVK